MLQAAQRAYDELQQVLSGLPTAIPTALAPNVDECDLLDPKGR